MVPSPNPARPKVQIVDPLANTPPYDHALSAALARAGADVELLTSRFVYGPTPPAAGYRVREDFYRRAASGLRGARSRRALRLIEHVPDMLRQRRTAPEGGIVHYQWLTLPALDRHLLASTGPRVFTVHHLLPVDPSCLRRREARLLLERMDTVVALSEHGAGRLRELLGAGAEKVRVIPHGALDYLTRQPGEEPLSDELAAVEAPVILHFGLIRPYKGVDVLLEAFKRVNGAELWIVGMPRMALDPLRRLAEEAPGRVRFVPRFVSDAELPAYFRRAEVVVLPYLEAEQSGVLYTALAFAKPLVLSRVGGLTEVAAEHGAGRLVAPGDPEELAGAITELLGDDAARGKLAEAAAVAAAGPYSWDAIASLHLELYRELLEA